MYVFAPLKFFLVAILIWYPDTFLSFFHVTVNFFFPAFTFAVCFLTVTFLTGFTAGFVAVVVAAGFVAVVASDDFVAVVSDLFVYVNSNVLLYPVAVTTMLYVPSAFNASAVVTNVPSSLINFTDPFPDAAYSFPFTDTF